MSKGKGSSYSVRENARLREEALRQLRENAADVNTRLQQVVARAGALAVSVEVPAFNGEASESELTRFVAEAARVSRLLETQILRREMLRQLDSFKLGRVDSLGGPVPTPVPDPTVGRRKAFASAQIERLRAPTSAETAKIEALTAELVACTDPARARKLEEQLRYSVQQSNDASDVRGERVAAAESSRERLRGLDNPEIGRLREQLNAIAATAAALPRELAEAVERARNAEVRRLDEAYVASVLRDELLKAGYEVNDEEFAAVMASGGRVVLPDQRNAGYALSFAATPDKKMLGMTMARIEDGTLNASLRARRDKEVEDDFCERYFTIAKELDRAGITHTLEQHELSGGRPVEVIDSAEARKRPAEQRRQAPRAKQLPRG